MMAKVASPIQGKLEAALTCNVLHFLRSWLEKSQSPRDLVPSVVYTYLRLIVDHKDSAFSMLRQREVEFCVTLLREKVGAWGSKCLCGI